MSQFHGFCSYPHGGSVAAGLILGCIAALACTMYGMASCRFVYIDFDSDRGSFGEFYLNPTPNGNSPTRYRAGVGLFTWLEPFEQTDWSQGQCVGYTELQRETFGDKMFEVARIFGVLCVLGGIAVTAWSFFLTCLSLRRIQIWAMSLILFSLACFVGLTSLIFHSDLCQDLVSNQNENYTTQCQLDQGGLVAVGGCILWCVTLLISIIYVKALERDLSIAPDGRITNALERRQEKKEKKGMRKNKKEQKQAKSFWKKGGGRSTPSSNPASPALESRRYSPRIDFGEDGEAEVEVQLGNHRGY